MELGTIEKKKHFIAARWIARMDEKMGGGMKSMNYEVASTRISERSWTIVSLKVSHIFFFFFTSYDFYRIFYMELCTTKIMCNSYVWIICAYNSLSPLRTRRNLRHRINLPLLQLKKSNAFTLDLENVATWRLVGKTVFLPLNPIKPPVNPPA